MKPYDNLFGGFEKQWKEERLISAHANGGPRSRVCARETLCSAPHRREWKFSAARVCSVTFKHIPKSLRNHIQSFRNLRQLLKIPPLSAQI